MASNNLLYLLYSKALTVLRTIHAVPSPVICLPLCPMSLRRCSALTSLPLIYFQSDGCYTSGVPGRIMSSLKSKQMSILSASGKSGENLTEFQTSSYGRSTTGNLRHGKTASQCRIPPSIEMGMRLPNWKRRVTAYLGDSPDRRRSDHLESIRRQSQCMSGLDVHSPDDQIWEELSRIFPEPVDAIAEKIEFWVRRQRAGESTDDFDTDLRLLA